MYKNYYVKVLLEYVNKQVKTVVIIIFNINVNTDGLMTNE